MNYYDLEDAVMMLHHVARTIERELGFDGTITKDLRRCADKLSDVIHAPVPEGKSDAVL